MVPRAGDQGQNTTGAGPRIGAFLPGSEKVVTKERKKSQKKFLASNQQLRNGCKSCTMVVAVRFCWVACYVQIVRERNSRTASRDSFPAFAFLKGASAKKIMGELIMMPSRNTETESVDSQDLGKPAKVVSIEDAFENRSTLDAHHEPAQNTKAVGEDPSATDFSIWRQAPKERTPSYFPTYSAVSRAMQAAMRGWVREWFQANPDILMRPQTAYPILVYQCTRPFAGKKTNIFTYDILETETLDKAFSSAAKALSRELKTLDTKRFNWFTREHYFAYRNNEVVKHVKKNRRAIYKMLTVDTVLMDSVLNFAVVDIPTVGLDAAVKMLRRAFEIQLRRFSTEIDMTVRVDELLKVATDALLAKLAADKVVDLPLEMPLAA